jgi:hypothetical protein
MGDGVPATPLTTPDSIRCTGHMVGARVFVKRGIP